MLQLYKLSDLLRRSRPIRPLGPHRRLRLNRGARFGRDDPLAQIIRQVRSRSIYRLHGAFGEYANAAAHAEGSVRHPRRGW
jgi:hypothetical protein